MAEALDNADIAVFDLGGTWFRWGRYHPSRGVLEPRRVSAINYLSHPQLSAHDLQRALTEFIMERTAEMLSRGPGLRVVSISIGAPVNANDQTVLGSGPLWGPEAKPLRLQHGLQESMPGLQWRVVNDITASLAPYMEAAGPHRKSLLITVSTGIGSRLYDHRARHIPYDATFGVQGEIGHLTLSFELEGRILNRRCECGGWNHLNAFCSGRAIVEILKSLPASSVRYRGVVAAASDGELRGDEEWVRAFNTQLERGNEAATALLDELVTPLSRTLACALCLDPEIDRVIVTGGVAHGLGRHYREALQRTFARDGLYQISEHDPDYLTRRLLWEEPDDFGGLRGAGVYAQMQARSACRGSS